MRAYVTILQVPPQLNQSYPGLDYFNFGACNFSKDGFCEPVQFINFMKCMFEPKMQGIDAFNYYFKPGVIAKLLLTFSDLPPVQNIIIGDASINPATGENMPLVLPT